MSQWIRLQPIAEVKDRDSVSGVTDDLEVMKLALRQLQTKVEPELVEDATRRRLDQRLTNVKLEIHEASFPGVLV